MKNNFTILDETSNDRKKATSILKFEINGREYLIYTINNGDDNTRILLLSSLYQENDKYSINDITEAEKNNLNQLVYNLIMSLPFQNNKVGTELITEFMDKNGVKISLNLPELSDEKYYANSLVAKANIETIEKAIDFYHIYLDEKEVNKTNENVTSTNTWEIPEVRQVASSFDAVNEEPPAPAINLFEGNEIQNSNVSNESAIPEATIRVEDNEIQNSGMSSDSTIPEANMQVESVIPQNINISTNANLSDGQVQTNSENVDNENFPNPQAEMLSRMDNLNPSNNLNVQPNIMRPNEKGNTSTKYIVIGTVSIILALLVVAVTYIMINNLK